MRLSCQVEFYASQDNSLHPRATCIRHFLLRLQEIGDVEALKKLITIGDTLTRFADLETIVLEIGYRLWPYNFQSLIGALRNVSGVNVQRRTSDQSYKLALQAKEYPSRSTNVELLSPFWCLQEHASNWDDWQASVARIQCRFS